jgi:hypothetical protein
MMTDGDVSARDRADDIAESPGANRAGQVAIGELLKVQSTVPSRGMIARVFGMSPLSHETHAMYRGVVGEIEVGESLDRLGPEWTVLHALPVDSGIADIDHLVVGPAGVFVVATKNHSGQNVWASQRTLMVGGLRQPHIRNMEYEMGRAERFLTAATGGSVEVSGILAVVAAKSLVVREKHRDVAVLAAGHLIAWLQRHRRVLSPAQISHISTAASLASTWDAPDPEGTAPDALRAQFEHLRADVRRAWRIQVTWAAAVSAVGIGAFAVVTYSILLSAIGSFGL